jgi:tetratricopeptide (TPR) repeat protein
MTYKRKIQTALIDKSAICCTMRNTAFTLALLMLIACASRPSYAADFQTEGFENVKAKNYAKALDCFTAASKEQPKNWQILQSIGNCHMRLGQNDAAISDLQKSIEAGGLHASQCTIMAAALEGQGKLATLRECRAPATKDQEFGLAKRQKQACLIAKTSPSKWAE